ncbi:hypothetical protein [Mesorhizobium sp. B2-4-19]|uniref:hypothetical protein n=1 Tax=Mesorhizobium sp. B2-4-19 TaxID=2589930 RepID=UPI001FEF7191|nr:hypothetical protein [Mesorhizobium sp. B2-4-19]
MKALADVVDRSYPGRSETLRPILAQEAKATMVIGMRIEEASAKVRAKGIGDDEEDYGHPVWGRRHPGADGDRRGRAMHETAARHRAAGESGWICRRGKAGPATDEDAKGV